MVSRSLLALLAIALIAASVNAAPTEDVEVDDDDFERSGLGDWFKDNAKKAAKKIIKEVLEYIKGKASRVNWDCAKEIFDECKINPVAHPKKYYKCAKNYIVENKQHCYPKAEKEDLKEVSKEEPETDPKEE